MENRSKSLQGKKKITLAAALCPVESGDQVIRCNKSSIGQGTGEEWL